MKLEDAVNYFPGKGCRCSARSAYECGCDVNWRPRIEVLVKAWRDMSAREMRLRCGELTASEIRATKAVLNAILPK